MFSTAGRILRDTVIDTLSLTTESKFLWKGMVKVFQDSAPKDMPAPYIIITYVTGGFIKQVGNRIYEPVWAVEVHTPSLEDAVEWGSRIVGLANEPLVVSVAGVCANDTLTVLELINQRYVAQDHVWYVKGALVKLDLSL